MVLLKNRVAPVIESLNPEQKEAALHIHGPLLVLAGAGTGKTKVITTRIANMVLEGISPKNIVAVSFTNKAAKEMLERVAHITTKKLADEIELSTFHSFALKLVRKYAPSIHLNRNFKIADEGEQANLLREALKEQKLEDILSLQHASERISGFKDQLFTEADFEKQGQIFDKAILKNLFVSYNRRLRLYNMVDFDDLVYLAALLLKNFPDIRGEIQDQHQYLMVDEYQDTSYGQLQFVKLIAGERENVCVVGDDDQSIYSWRGAKPDTIFQFLKSYPNAKRVTLEQNYRCSPNILNAANAVIAKNSNRLGKTLWSRQSNTFPVRLHAAENERDEALFLVETIKSIKDSEPQFRYDDVAVLVRSNKQTVALDHVFSERQIPFVIHGRSEFFDRKEIRDLFSYLKLAYHRCDLYSLFRIINLPARGIGIATLEKIKTYHADKKVSGTDLSVEDILDVFSPAHSGIEQFRNFWKQSKMLFMQAQTPNEISKALETAFVTLGLKQDILSTSANMHSANLRIDMVNRVFKIVENIELRTGEGPQSVLDALHLDESRFGSAKESRGKVQIMTMHSSKGLEFPCVFLIGIEEDILPHERSLELAHGEEEERRLFYVALTRAKQRLFISHCGFRQKGKKSGKEREPIPSRFLNDIPDSLLSMSETSPHTEEARRMDAAKKLFDMFR